MSFPTGSFRTQSTGRTSELKDKKSSKTSRKTEQKAKKRSKIGKNGTNGGIPPQLPPALTFTPSLHKNLYEFSRKMCGKDNYSWFIPLYAKTAARSTAPKQDAACSALNNAAGKRTKNESAYAMEPPERKGYARSAGEPLKPNGAQAIFAAALAR